MSELPDGLAELVESCDVFLVETSTLEYMECGDLYLNPMVVMKEFVRGAGRGALAWFRQLSDTPSPPAIVDAALQSIRESGKSPDALAEEVLASTILVRTTPESLAEQLTHMVFGHGKRWIFAPIFNISDKPEEWDPKRAELRDQIAAVAVNAGVEFFDPTPLVVRAGRAVALMGEGADTHHYAPDILPTVGEALRDALVGATEAQDHP